MIEILKTKKYLLLSLCLVTTNLLSQFSIEKITFNSANPFSLNDIISNLKNQDKQEVYGTLIIPDSTNLEKIPLIIGVAGSYGWGEHHFQYLEMFRQMGIATFELNSFKSRNITSTVGSQTEITMAAMILDAYRALEVLSSHPKIDKEKISIVGWSLGGGVTLFSGWLPVKNAINKELNFASHLAFYPPCFIDPENTDFTKSGIIINNRNIITICEESLHTNDFIIVSVIAPFKNSRNEARVRLGGKYIEVYVEASLKTVINRDTKGHYKKALGGKIDHFIGIDPMIPYEKPINPEIIINTDNESEERSIKKLLDYLKNMKYI